MFDYTIDYLSNPKETIYFINSPSYVILKAMVEDVSIKTFMRNREMVQTTSYTVKTTIEDNETYVELDESDIFLTYEEAYQYIFGNDETPTPTSTPLPTETVVPPTSTPLPTETMVTPTPSPPSSNCDVTQRN